MNFLNKCKNKYPDEFDYSKVIYTNAKTKTSFICKKHNFEFQITPTNFLSYKYPCPICRKENGRSKNNEKNAYYSVNINDKIIQCDKNKISIISEYNNLDDIFIKTTLNKIKKSDIKRCCNLNHYKINDLVDENKKIKFNKISSSCSNIWFYKMDYKKILPYINTIL